MQEMEDQIKDNFYRGYTEKAMKLNGLPENYPAWTIKFHNWFGIAVPYDGTYDFSEHFSEMQIRTEKGTVIDGKEYNLLMLICGDMTLRDEFSLVCSQFAEPGENGRNRLNLVNNPETWWRKWKGLLGNISADREAYSVLGELTALAYFMKKGYNPIWTGQNSATNDIEMNSYSAEVKSTTSRYGYEITVSSIYQLRAEHKLDLVFCRFEKNTSGRSIDDIVEELISLGYDGALLEKGLKKCGFEQGCTARKYTYKLLEMKKYSVDEGFPMVTEHSFKDDCLPPHIVKFSYTVDLSGIACENLL